MLLLVCVGTTSVFVCYTWLQSLDGVMCFNLFLLVQRVYVCVCVCVCLCYSVQQRLNDVLFCDWFVLVQRVCMCVIYSTALSEYCDVF